MSNQADSLEYERVAGIIERQIDAGAFGAAEYLRCAR
jgi:hypothetical protein